MAGCVFVFPTLAFMVLFSALLHPIRIIRVLSYHIPEHTQHFSYLCSPWMAWQHAASCCTHRWRKCLQLPRQNWDWTIRHWDFSIKRGDWGSNWQTSELNMNLSSRNRCIIVVWVWIIAQCSWLLHVVPILLLQQCPTYFDLSDLFGFFTSVLSVDFQHSQHITTAATATQLWLRGMALMPHEEKPCCRATPAMELVELPDLSGHLVVSSNGGSPSHLGGFNTTMV